MKTRNGLVSNSSSSSFVVALRKGHSWADIIEEAGDFSQFAEMLSEFVGKHCAEFQTIENVALANALRDYANDDYAVEAVKAGEYDFIEQQCRAVVENPSDWMFARGYASYNDTYDPIEVFLGYGGTIDGANIKVVHGED